MNLTLEDIAIAFKNCNGEAKCSFKEKIKELNKLPQDYKNGFTVSDLNDFIFHDIEKLLSKGVLNIGAADFLSKKGYFSWAFVTSYYANFFLIQGLNRTQLHFTTWINHSVICKRENFVEQTIYIKTVDRSTDEHQRQFQRFFDNFNIFRSKEGIDRYWNLGLKRFVLGDEPKIRNRINYEISPDAFYELDLNENDFQKIIKENKHSPFKNFKENTKYTNYSHRNLQLAIARLRMLTYILNVIAIKNLEYQSYYKRNMNHRLNAIRAKYPDISQWIQEYFNKWLSFDSELFDPDEI